MGVRVPSFAPTRLDRNRSSHIETVTIIPTKIPTSDMQTQLETISSLERRLTMAVPSDQIEKEVNERLKRLSGTVRMAGFRPGKVPLKIISQQYGPQVRSEVVGDAVQKAFTAVVSEQNLRVAGYPRIE